MSARARERDDKRHGLSIERTNADKDIVVTPIDGRKRVGPTQSRRGLTEPLVEVVNVTAAAAVPGLGLDLEEPVAATVRIGHTVRAVDRALAAVVD